jgi:GAF domain-containing protein/HAMP domain-containing protein
MLDLATVTVKRNGSSAAWNVEYYRRHEGPASVLRQVPRSTSRWRRIASWPSPRPGRTRAGALTRRRRLFWKYVVVMVALVGGALLASGLIEIYFSYQENKDALVALQREKAVGAAARIESFIKEIEHQMGWTTQLQLVASGVALEQRRIDYLRLQRQVPAITEVSYLDASGREQLFISRLAMEVMGSQTDYSKDPRFAVPRSGRVYHGPVFFRKESEPYMAIALPVSGGGVTVAEVNLKFIWDVVSKIKVGQAGRAFVVDGQGALIAHPDISLVLQKTNLSKLDQVRAALAAPDAGNPAPGAVPIARDLWDRRVLTAHSTIAPLRWSVFVEQPLEEAFQPLSASVTRTGLLILLGVMFAVGASLLLARRMVQPSRALEQGAAKIGAGELRHRIEVKTGEEVEALAERFHDMTGQLQESYATLEQRVVERTRELSEALQQQTAMAEVLRVISSSPTDLTPVYRTILSNVTTLCDASIAVLFLYDGQSLFTAAHVGTSSEFAAHLERSRPRLSHETTTRLAALERHTIHVPDLLGDPAFAPSPRELYERENVRTILSVPLLRESSLIGVITTWRREVRPFSDAQVGLVQTFADQAVIAIENVRLFTELQARTDELSRSVQELTALGEVSQALSSTLHLETVLATIAARANQLAGADGCAIYGYDADSEEFRLLRASDDFAPAFLEAIREQPIPKAEGILGRAATCGEAVQVADIAVGMYRSPVRDLIAASGYRALLAIPLRREEDILGGLVVNRKAPRRVSRRGGERPQDICHPVRPGHPERAPVRRDRGEDPRTGKSHSPQVGVPGQHVARAAHAAQRRDRILRGPAGPHHVRRYQRQAGGVPQRHPQLRAPSALAHQRHPRPLQGRGRANGAGGDGVRPPPGYRQCADPRPGAGRRARHRARGRRRRASGGVPGR